MKPTFMASVVLLLGACASRPASAPFVEIEALLSNPTTYAGQIVRIRGAAVVRFEANFICATPELIDGDTEKKCLWLTPDKIGGKAFDLRPFHRKKVVLVGRFDPTRFGHMGAYGGTIAVKSGRTTGTHGEGDIPPPPLPPRSSANTSFKPTPLRSAP